MAEYRKVQLTAAPTIEIGDINDITGTISDKERHITTGKIEVSNVPLPITGVTAVESVAINSGIIDVVREIGSGKVEVSNVPLPVTGIAAVESVAINSGIIDVVREIGSGRIDISNIPLPVTGTVTVEKTSITSGIIDLVREIGSGRISVVNPLSAAGNVKISIEESPITVPVTGNIAVAKAFTSIKVLDNVTVPATGIVTGSAVHIDVYETKTVAGKTEFNGKVHIDLSPSGTDNFLQDIYVVDISSGQAFSASFSEAFDYVIVRVENTSTTTGSANVWVNTLS